MSAVAATAAALVFLFGPSSQATEPNRGEPFSQPTENAGNPSTERNIFTENNLGYISCNDDLTWKPFTASDNAVTVQDYLQSPAGQHCHCPRSGRWAGKLTNGTWYWNYDAGSEDWDVTPGVDGKPAVASGRGTMSATSIWEFWSTDKTGKPLSFSSEDLISKPPQEGERFWVAQEVTIWGQPERGAEWVEETGKFQTSKKFAELDDQGNVMRDDKGNILYKGSSISLVYECQTLYTDTLAPDRRDGGCSNSDPDPSAKCGGPPSPLQQTPDEALKKPKIEDVEEVMTPGPAPTKQFPHKMAWYMFLTASSGPQFKGGQSNSRYTYRTCDDVNRDATCQNRDTASSSYTWMPGVNVCPNSFTKPFQGFSKEIFVNQPLCPDCIPSTQYLGSDGGGYTPNFKHDEIKKQGASDLNGLQGLPPCATKRDPASLDAKVSLFYNRLLSFHLNE